MLVGYKSFRMTKKSTRIAFLTSGGDAPGMNAAIRAIVRMAIHRGCQPFAVMEGLRGLTQGGSMIVEFGWADVAQIIGIGGTVIKSSRAPQFLERSSRMRATLNLVSLGIDKLIVIGGDGSLTGADILRQEWEDHLAELIRLDMITRAVADAHPHLMLVGIAGSIDNDMVGTEATIGANSSLHRIIEAIDCIHSTASSHQRAFVIEVMGRHCGWLALNAAISCAADWLFIPEDPPADGWELAMCDAISRNRAMGRSVSIVMIAEGAVDRRNVTIRSEFVKDLLISSGLDARVTTLGHIQRGGNPSALDRTLATLQGIKAVEAVIDSDPMTTPSLLVGINENAMTCRPLMDCIAKTRAVNAAMEQLCFSEALALRDPDFCADYAMWQLIRENSIPVPHEEMRTISEAMGTPSSTTMPPLGTVEKDRLGSHQPLQKSAMRIGIIHCGAPSGGMNAALAAALFYSIKRNITIVGIFNGFDGLIGGEARVLTLADVLGLVETGGSILGTNRTLPGSDFEGVAQSLSALALDGLILVGGFEAYSSSLQLAKARPLFACFAIPIVVIPATISNNVPGTEFSIGSDTALNVIVQSCDYIKQSASSSRKRVFVVDVHGGYCGYLATLTALASSASQAYTHEDGLRLSDLHRDATHLTERFVDDRRQGRLVIRNEFCHATYSAELISKILENEGKGAYDSRWVMLGHLQQGGSPSPLDRVRAIRLAILSVNYIETLVDPTRTAISKCIQGVQSVPRDCHCADRCLAPSMCSTSNSGSDSAEEPSDCVVIGIRGPRVRFTPSLALEEETDMKLRRPRVQWWLHLLDYMRILSKCSPRSPAESNVSF